MFYFSDSKWDKVQLECIKCLKAIMNNKIGLRNLFDHKEALTLLARSIQPTGPKVMLEACSMMAAVCIVPPDGHEKVRIRFLTLSELLCHTPSSCHDTAMTCNNVC